MKDMLKAIVIGSGVAGIATAIRLAAQGVEVTVFEKNEYPGGKLYDFQLNGFHFDAGPSLFTQPQNIEEIFKLVDENIDNYFEYISVPIACKYFYEDGIILTAYTEKEKFIREISEKIGEDPHLVQEYLQQSAKLYNTIGSVFLNHPMHKRRSFFKAGIFKTLNTVRWKYLFNTLNGVNSASFTKPHTIQLFNRYATYTGSDPYKAPAMLCLIAHLEFNEGVFYPKGGMISITKALYKLALKKGVQFKFNTPVQRIIYHEGKVKGVVANNMNIVAHVVVSNADIYCTSRDLLNNEIESNKLLKQERSSSALVFYWGINKQFPQLHLHNILFSKNYKSEFNHIFRYKKMYNDPTIYINITSKCELGLAPAGRENWFVMVNVPANFGQNWNVYKQEARANIIAKLNRMLQTDIEPLIEVEQTLDPVSIEEETGAFKGAIYGASSNSKLTAFLRNPNFSKHIKGLYFAGGTVHPGGGVPLCLKSAKIVSELAEKDVKDFVHK
jgi:phytoene desaturase